MNNSMYMNVENMKSLANSFAQKINSLDTLYKDIASNMKDLDGTNDYWKGDNQKLFYESFSKSLNKYPVNIDKLKEFHSFLVKTINDYETRDQDINKEIDDGDDKFDL